MKALRFRLLSLSLCGVVLGTAVAQDAPPTGPAQIINRAASAREQRGMARATAAADKAQGVVLSPEDASFSPQVAASSAAPTADPAPELPQGTLQVDVVDAAGQPHANAEIVLGIMQSTGGRDEQRATTDENGRYTFRGLPVGSAQAYRVNVPAAGAKFSSNPFRMPDGTGFRVRIPLRSTTREDRFVFALVGQTAVELRDDRLHITQQARLANAGESVYVLPKEGLLVRLPAGFTAFQWQDVMTDQKGTEVAGEGFRIRGSIPPGKFDLTWAYDVPREGTTARIPVTPPFRTYSYRVIAEAPVGLSVHVADFPEAERVKDQGRTLLFTQVRRAPSDAPIGTLTVRIDGIPGPGPGRWIAVALFALTVLAGLFSALRSPDDAGTLEERRRLFGERKAALLEAAKRVEAELVSGDIGPAYHARRLSELETELATVLCDESALSQPAVS